MIRRNQKLVLRYYKPNRQLYPEKFAYHVLLLFYPFINKSDLFSKDGNYSSKLLEPVVKPQLIKIDRYLSQIVN